MRLFLVRHGETLFNRSRRFQHGGVPLSTLGKEQAAETGERLVGCGIEKILASDMQRAKETAGIIGDCINTDNVEYLPELREVRRPSHLQGLWHYDPRALWVVGRMFLHAKNPSWYYSDEENVFDHTARVTHLLRYIETLELNRVLVVSHRVTIAMMLFLMRNPGKLPSPRRFALSAYFNYIKNASITVCDYKNGTWTISAFDEAHHLQQPTD